MSRSLEAAQSSLTAEHRDRRQCHQQKLGDMHLEAVHSKDSTSLLWQNEFGIELTLALHADSTATISQHTEMGLGCMKHVELRFFVVKDLLKRERLTLSKTGTENPADLATKGAGGEHSSAPVTRSLVCGLRNRRWRRSRVTRETCSPLEVLDC